MTTFTLPDLGEGLVEAEIVAWHVTPGDHAIADQPLVSVETDKAVVEIPCPWSGTIEKLHAAAGEILPIGAPLADIATGAATDSGAIVGEIAAAKTPPPRPAAKPAPTTGSVAAAPAVRQLAKRLGVDLDALTGSGPEGAILSADVEAAAQTEGGEPLRGVRRAMAKAMAAAGAAVVPATLTDLADVGAWDTAGNPSLRLIRAIAAACAAEPALNARFDGARRFMNGRVDLAIAVDTPDGLFAPVLRAIDRASPEELAHRLTALKQAVANRSLAPEDLRGGSITLSNFGMMGGEHAALVVSPPQVAILGAGRIHDAVLAVDGAVVIRRVMPLSLTFDHRAVTGGEAARFMAAIRADLESAE
jgi:pyruvate dehydrogenase E2 component (dihydrolipoamide acetyltransferase)